MCVCVCINCNWTIFFVKFCYLPSTSHFDTERLVCHSGSRYFPLPVSMFLKLRTIYYLFQSLMEVIIFGTSIPFSQLSSQLKFAETIITLSLSWRGHTRVGTLIVATIYLQLIQNRYMFRSFAVLKCSHQHCVQPVASDVEVVGYL